MRQLYSGLLLLSDFALSQNKLSDPYTEYDSLRFNFENAEDKEITVWPEIYRFPIYDTQQINNGLVAILGSDYLAKLSWSQVNKKHNKLTHSDLNLSLIHI